MKDEKRAKQMEGKWGGEKGDVSKRPVQAQRTDSESERDEPPRTSGPSGPPGLDESRLQRPKAGGFRPEAGQRSSVSQTAEGLKLFKQLPRDQEDHSARLIGSLLETQI
ncbi:hypothetical protein KUCAC02_022785 [Chaenocephalus aceratus]|uniref:Uncharacterized protein n=1 Tax=Chaenocephalus aceratus TaxID=36190 RepID=A0ACB9XNR6_CHAAC|nr:hypothetical protein KUCAC02_022785 [Chaenocephalus aceratus]